MIAHDFRERKLGIAGVLLSDLAPTPTSSSNDSTLSASSTSAAGSSSTSFTTSNSISSSRSISTSTNSSTSTSTTSSATASAESPTSTSATSSTSTPATSSTFTSATSSPPVVQTVGQTLTLPNSAAGQTSTPTPSATPTPTAFLQNKALSGLVFGLVGLVSLVLIVIVATCFIRRRRQKNLLQEAVKFDPTSITEYEEDRQSDHYRSYISTVPPTHLSFVPDPTR